MKQNILVCKECYHNGSHWPYYDITCKKLGHHIKDTNNIKKILVCPNGLEGDIFLNIITDIIRLLTEDNIFNYQFIFRMHPNKQWEKYTDEFYNNTIASSFFNKNFLVFDKKTDLYEQILSSDLVIVGETSVSYEVLALGIKVVHFIHDKSMGHINKEVINSVNNTAGLYNIILEVLE